MATGRNPLAARGRPVLQLPQWHMKSHYPVLAGFQVNSVERRQAAHWELHACWNLGRCAKVDLGDFIACHFSCVPDVDCDVKTAVESPFDFQFGIFESGVTQAMTEREQWIDIFMVKPAVAHIHAFAESRFAVLTSPGTLRVAGIGGGLVFQASAPGYRQATCRACLAKQYVGCGPASFVARPPHL